MFRKPSPPPAAGITPTERVTSVLGPGLTWTGSLRGSVVCALKVCLKVKFTFAASWSSVKVVG